MIFLTPIFLLCTTLLERRISFSTSSYSHV
jgi:hypothetical protein